MQALAISVIIYYLTAIAIFCAHAVRRVNPLTLAFALHPAFERLRSARS